MKDVGIDASRMSDQGLLLTSVAATILIGEEQLDVNTRLIFHEGFQLHVDEETDEVSTTQREARTGSANWPARISGPFFMSEGQLALILQHVHEVTADIVRVSLDTWIGDECSHHHVTLLELHALMFAQTIGDHEGFQCAVLLIGRHDNDRSMKFLLDMDSPAFMEGERDGDRSIESIDPTLTDALGEYAGRTTRQALSIYPHFRFVLSPLVREWWN